MGVAFAAVVTAVVDGLVTPLIAMVVGKASLSSLTFTINDAVFTYGAVLDAIIQFVAIAAVVFFLIVKPVNALISRSRREPSPDPTTKKCPECLSEIPLEARRCSFCTVVLVAA
jgi:large conductance mechanosensitive channel